MSIFNFLRRKLAQSDSGPPLKFGRHATNIKEQEEQALLGEAINLFEDDKRLEALEYLLNYLRNDLEDNLLYDVENGEIFFEIIQGSKKIMGRCNSEKFVAISEIATVSGSNIGLYRKLLDRNYMLKYCRFCLESNKLVIKFDSFTMDASPHKVFHALKELATNADKYDDLLVDEFDELENILSGKIINLDEDILQKKEDYLRNEITSLLESIRVQPGHIEHYHVGVSYLLLHCAYKLDYLVKPEGYVMEVLEKNHRIFFEKNNKSSATKNEEIKENFQLILSRTSEQLQQEFYETIHTFEYTKPAGHEELKSLIATELPKAASYHTIKEHHIVLAITGYIASFSLFHYSLPTPDLDMLHLLIRVHEDEFFNTLGYSPSYMESGVPVQKVIENRILHIIEENKSMHPYFAPAYEKLVYDDLASFSHSFLQMIASYDIHYQKQLM